MVLHRRHTLFLLRALFFLALPLCANAFEPATGWYARAWQTDDGLPSANVTGIAQTRDGFLWLATQSGLARFDGVKIEEVPVILGRQNPIIRAMLCDHAEHFWLAEDNGIVIVMADKTREALILTPANDIPDSTPTQITEAGDHSVWIAYSDGSVCRVTPSNAVERFDETSGLPNAGQTCSLATDTNGVVWFAKGGWVGAFNGKRFDQLFEIKERSTQVLPSPRGGIWVCTPLKLFKYQTNGTSSVMADLGNVAGRLRIVSLFEDSTGRLWIGTAANGLLLFEAGNLSKVETSQDRIRVVSEDREGSIWVGTDGGGLDRVRQKVIEMMGRGQGLPFETVRSLCEDSEGFLWVVTQDGALTRLTGDHWDHSVPNPDWPGYPAHCVASDKSGVIWIGTYLRGLYKLKDGNFSRYTTKEGLGGATVRSLLVGRNGDLWIGLENGLVQRFHEGQFESIPLPEGSRAVRAMVEDSEGQIWMGTLSGKLLCLKDHQLTDLTAKTDEPFHPIRCMNAMPDGSLWIGYAVGGLGRIKNGHFSRIRLEQGLYDNNICAFMPDNAGRMWIAADKGIFSVETAELNAVADDPSKRLTCFVYGRDDGLPGLQAYYGYSPGAVQTRAGQILFPTHSGIAVVYPGHALANTVPPVVHIKSVSIAGNPLPLPENGHQMRLKPGLRNLEITFTTPSYIAPEKVSFQYRLAGWSDGWVESGRERAAKYERLAPGSYEFQVRARNSSGVESEHEATLKFVLLPYVWESGYFTVLVVAFFAAVLALAVRHFSLARARELLRRAEHASALQKERERIAQDMHDELGAQFTQISLLGELARTDAMKAEKSVEHLEKISVVACEGVKSLDEIVWAVNPRNDSMADLLDYTGQYALGFLSTAGIRGRLDFPEQPPEREISGEVRHSVFLIVKESLHNVVRHAKASEARIFFDFDDVGMRWIIQDNGMGFAEPPDNALADGLRNMRQRAESLGGELHVKSAPGCGTKVYLHILWNPVKEAGE